MLLLLSSMSSKEWEAAGAAACGCLVQVPHTTCPSTTLLCVCACTYACHHQQFGCQAYLQPAAACCCLACGFALQDPPLPWITADRRILNPAIHVGTQLDKLVAGGHKSADTERV